MRVLSLYKEDYLQIFKCVSPREGPGGQVENVHLRIPSVIVKGD